MRRFPLRSRPKDRLRPRPGSRRRYQFTREDCQRGYQAARAKCVSDWNLFAWFFRRVRGWY